MSSPRDIGTLIVVVLKARNLPNKRHIGKQDPYCAVIHNGEKRRTRAIKRGGQHPEWDDEVRFTIYEDAEDELARTAGGGADGEEPPLPPPKEGKKEKRVKGGKTLNIACYADDPKEPDLIGEAVVDLSEVLTKGETDEWFTLMSKDKYCGEVYLELTFWSNEKPPEKKQKKVAKPNKQYGGPGSFVSTDEAARYHGNGDSVPSSLRASASLKASGSLANVDLYVPPYEKINNTILARGTASTSASIDQLADEFGGMGVRRRESYPPRNDYAYDGDSSFSSINSNSSYHSLEETAYQDPYARHESTSTYRSVSSSHVPYSDYSANNPYEQQAAPAFAPSHSSPARRAPRTSLPPASSGFVSFSNPSPSGFVPIPTPTPAPSNFAQATSPPPVQQTYQPSVSPVPGVNGYGTHAQYNGGGPPTPPESALGYQQQQQQQAYNYTPFSAVSPPPAHNYPLPTPPSSVPPIIPQSGFHPSISPGQILPSSTTPHPSHSLPGPPGPPVQQYTSPPPLQQSFSSPAAPHGGGSRPLPQPGQQPQRQGSLPPLTPPHHYNQSISPANDQGQGSAQYAQAPYNSSPPQTYSSSPTQSSPTSQAQQSYQQQQQNGIGLPTPHPFSPPPPPPPLSKINTNNIPPPPPLNNATPFRANSTNSPRGRPSLPPTPGSNLNGINVSQGNVPNRIPPPPPLNFQAIPPPPPLPSTIQQQAQQHYNGSMPQYSNLPPQPGPQMFYPGPPPRPPAVPASGYAQWNGYQ